MNILEATRTVIKNEPDRHIIGNIIETPEVFEFLMLDNRVDEEAYMKHGRPDASDLVFKETGILVKDVVWGDPLYEKSVAGYDDQKIYNAKDILKEISK